MSANQKQDFLQHYRNLTDDELVDIYRKGTLTEIASEAMMEVLGERGLSTDDIAILKNEFEAEENTRLASLGDRFLAQFTDGLVALLFGIVFYLIGTLFKGEWIAIIGYLGYYIFSDGLHHGQSFGKRLVKIAVINKKNGTPCNFYRSAVRNCSLLLLGFIDVVFIFGQNRQRLGDFAADTEVVNITP
jgi:uncharacterized RDD family membrane protein YckC